MNTLKTLLAVCLFAIFPSLVSAQEAATPNAFAGRVTEISDTSISIKRLDQIKTLAIDSSTQILDAANISEIQVGQIVAVRIDASGTKASLIRAKWNQSTAVSPTAPAESK